MKQMISVYVVMSDPKMHVKKITDHDRCLLLEINTDEDVLALHFESRDDLVAFSGLVQIAAGQAQ